MIFFSCEKTVPDNEIPDWLKTKISQDEQIIAVSPKASSAWGAWIRYKWEKDYYFEYTNIVSSSLYIPISVTGDSLYQSVTNPNIAYSKEKCCKQFVWKGPLFKDY
jgi:hypothetical protein